MNYITIDARIWSVGVNKQSFVPKYGLISCKSLHIRTLRYFLRSDSNRMNYPTTPYQSFEDPAARTEGVSNSDRSDNGRLKSPPSLVDSIHHDIPSSEYISGLDTYRSLTNTVTSVPTHPTFRLRVSEYSTKRKHSFVRFSKKFNQAKQVC